MSRQDGQETRKNGKAKPGGASVASEPALEDIHLEGDLPPEVKEAFTLVVRRLEKRRKINLAGYLLALVVMITGLVGGLAYMGGAAKGEFRGWILVVPLALIGLIFWVFGRWAKRA